MTKLTVAYVRAFGLVREGASRRLAAFVADAAPDILGVSQIEPGDALTLATRFALQWSYRGGQALFWNARFKPQRVRDLYLPSAAIALERRGFLRVDGALDDRACTLVATQFGTARERYVPQLRFARAQLRACARDAFLLAHLPATRIGVADVGFRALAEDEFGERVRARGFEDAWIELRTAKV